MKNLPDNARDVREMDLIPGSGRFPWRRYWLAIPVFLAGKSQGQRSLAGYSPWGQKKSDMIEQLSMHTHAHTHTILDII